MAFNIWSQFTGIPYCNLIYVKERASIHNQVVVSNAPDTNLISLFVGHTSITLCDFVHESNDVV